MEQSFGSDLIDEEEGQIDQSIENLFGDVETNGCGGRKDGPASRIHNISPSTSLDSCSDATCIGCPDVPLNYRDDVSLKTSDSERGRMLNQEKIPAKRVSVISSETTRMLSRVERSSSAISSKSHSSHAPPVAVAYIPLEYDKNEWDEKI
jgi:hypothetical protein